MAIYKVIRPKNKEQWLKTRGIGGSSASAILNLNPYMSANDLYDSICFPKEHVEKDTEATERGVALEPLIRDEFKALYINKFKINNPPKNNWVFVRKDKPYLTASLDGVLTDIETKEKGVLEIKTREIRSYEEMEEWKNGNIPNNYYIQLIHYLMVTGFEYAYIVAHLIIRDYDTDEIKKIETIVNKVSRVDRLKDIELLEKKETDFYNNTLNRIRPKNIIHVYK